MNLLKATIGLSLLIFITGCADYTISTQSLVSQLQETQKIKKTIYTQFAIIKYPSNNLKKIKCEDKNGNNVWLYPNRTTGLIIVKKSDGKKVETYFDTVFLKNDTLYGLRSRLIGGLRFVPVSDIEKISINTRMSHTEKVDK